MAASLLRMHTALPEESVWAAVEILMEVPWEPRSCRGSMALLGMVCSQGFCERPLKKSGNGFQEAKFSTGPGPSWWVEDASHHLHFWVLFQSGSLALHV